MGVLTDEERVLALSKRGESEGVEYKELLSSDERPQRGRKDRVERSLRAVVAFLNSQGGSLLVGVRDDGEILGLNREVEQVHRSRDELLLFWTNKLRDQIGPTFFPFIESRLVDVSGRLVLMVQCRRAQRPCFLNDREFFIRLNNATQRLEGQDLWEYLRERF